MARRKKKRKNRPRAKSAKSRPFHNPFLDSAKELKRRLAQPAAEAEPAPPAVEPDDDAAEFRRAMAGVTPLEFGPEIALPTTRPGPRPAEDEDLEALAHLADLVAGEVALDVRDTDEYVEGSRPGLNPEIVNKLAAGLFPIHDHLDLHGLTVNEAQERVFRFVIDSRRLGHRCVLVIHGRGLGSPEGKPVLKPHVVAWLSRSALRKHVLAFATARPYDGGAGAVYVLLKG